MSVRKFIQRTQLLLEQALHESRQALKQQDASSLRPMELSQLEERILMSASPMAVVAEAPEAATAQMDSAEQQYALSDEQLLDVMADSILPDQDAISQQTVDSETAFDDSIQQTLELVFIDAEISNLDQMIADLQMANANDQTRILEVVVLDSKRDGIAQITSALLQYNGIDGIHIVSHGSDGQVQLGSTTLSLDNLDSYRSAISAWQYSMSEEADILIYGCNVAATADGQLLLNELSTLTDSDVAASENLTGATDPGGDSGQVGDWHFEYIIGEVTT